MKLRQKLAMVLATAMVVTAVPVVTYAESTNKISHTISSVDGTVADNAEGLSLIMDFADTIGDRNGGKTSFYLDAKDFKFSAVEYAKAYFSAAKSVYVNALNKIDWDTTAAGLNLDTKYYDADVVVTDIVVGLVDNTARPTLEVKSIEFDVTYTLKANVTTTPAAADIPTNGTVKVAVKTVNNTSVEAEQIIEEAEAGLSTEVYFDEDGNALAARPRNAKAPVTVEYLLEDQLRVTVDKNACANPSKVKVRIPVLGTVKKGSPTVTVDPLDSYATGGTYFLTRESVEDGNRLAVSVAEAAPIPVDGGAISDITITEREEYSIKDPANADTDKEKKAIIKNNKVTFELPASSDLVFAKESTQEKYVRFTGRRAFAPNKNMTHDQLDNVTFEVSKDGKLLTIGLPTNREADTTTGEWIISGIQVIPEESRYDAVTGDVDVTIDGEMIAEKSHKVGVITDYDQTLTVDEVEELYSGKGSKEVVVTLQENVKESLDDKRWAYFELSEGAYIKANAGTEKDSDDNVKSLEAIEKIVKLNINGTDVTSYDEDLMQLIMDEDGNVKGFKVQFEYLNDKDEADAKKGQLDPNKANKIKFTFNVQADSETTGKVELKADSKAFEVEPLHIANVTAPIEVSFDATTVKVGLEKQALGKVTIKETAAGMLTKGELVIDADEDGVKFVSNAKDLKVTTPEGSTLKVEVKRVDKNGIVLSVDRTAKEASEFTIEGIVADIDRTVPEGEVAIQVFGDALRAFDGVWGDSEYNEKDGHKPGKGYIYEANKVEEFDAPHRFTADGYIVVGTKNTEDLPSAAKAKEIILTVNSKEYTVNGEAKTADAAAFIDANNRTMVPVKFVAEEFGRIEFGTINGVGTVTVFKDADVLQFQNGSNIMNKNGIAIPMDTKTVIKDGRTYVPFKYVAQGLGINYSFDNATKSVTFTNQVK